MPPAVSVIVPMYNVRDYVAECLDSVLAQTFTDFEVLVIDDASHDGSAEIADARARSDPRLRRIRHERNRGLPASRNTGLRHAAGRYVFHVDSDDRVPPRALEELVTAAEQDGADAVMGHALALRRSGLGTGPSLTRFQRHRRGVGYAEEPALWWGGNVFLFLFRRAFVMERALYLDEDIGYGEDQVYLSKILPHVTNATLLPTVVYHYRQREGSMSGAWSMSEASWLDFARWQERAARYRAGFPPALNYALNKDWFWRAAMLVLARKKTSEPAFRRMLEYLAAAYGALDYEAALRHEVPGHTAPRVPQPLMGLFEAIQSGDIDRAVAAVDLTARTVASERLLRIWELHGQHLWQDMKAETEIACREHPSIGFYPYLLGMALQGSGELDGAEAAFRRALALDPALADAVVELARVHERTGREGEVVPLCRAALERGLVSAGLHTTAGRRLILDDRPAEAEAHLRAALVRDAETLVAHTLLALAIRNQGRLDEALALAADTVRQFPGRPEARDAYDRLKAQKDRVEAARLA